MGKIIIAYENNPHPSKSVLETGWGLSVFIDYCGKKVLFDTGWNGDILMRNCAKLGISIADLDAVIISHAHWDHMGGLPQVIERVKHAKIYLPDDYSTNQMNEIKRINPPLDVFKNKDFRILDELSSCFALTDSFLGDMRVKEQALIIKDTNGVGLLLVGCSHPGLQVFIDASKKFIPVRKILGGFHGFKDTSVLINENFTHIFLGHCTEHRAVFQNLPGINTSLLTIGFEIEF